MRVTIKGQVTIPQEIRERHGFLPGTEVRFVEEDGVVRLEKETGASARGRELVDAMSRKGRARTPTDLLTTDQIMALTRGEDEG